MKLHLPKQLFTTLLAVITLAAPAAHALTLTDGYHKTYSLSESWEYTDSSGQKVSYDAATGKFTGYNMTANTLTLNMQTSWTNESAGLLIGVDVNINNEGTVSGITNETVGLYANGNGTVSGYWSQGPWNATTDFIPADKVTSYGDHASFTVSIAYNDNNTAGIKNGVTVFNPYGGTDLYYKSGLKGSNTAYNGSETNYLNSNLIDAIVVTNTSESKNDCFYASNHTGSWAQQFNKGTTFALLDKGVATEVNSGTDLTDKTDFVIGGSAQLYLNAESAELTIGATPEQDGEAYATSFYIGRTMFQDSADTSNNHAAIRFGNTNNAITVNGNIYIVDNASLTAKGSSDISIKGTVSDKVLSSTGETVSTNSTLSLSGTGYNFSGAVDVTGLNLTDGAGVTFNNRTVISTITNNGAITNNGTMVLGSTMVGAGTVTNGEHGRIELGAYTLRQFEGVTYSNETSGFVKSLTVFGKNVSYTEDVEDVEGVYVYVGDSSYKVDNGSIVLNGADTTYYVNETSHTVSATDETKASAFYINTGASLNKVSNSTAKLAGSGVYILGSVNGGGANAVLSGVTLDETTWTGTVEITGGGESNKVQKIDFNELGHIGSTVKIGTAGLYGYLKDSDNYTYNPNIELLGDLIINDGYSGTNNAGYSYTFLGDISGAGSFKKIVTNGLNQKYHFRGDLSNWTGSITNTVDTTTNVYLEGNAHTVGASINKGSGSLNLTVATDAAATLKNTVTVNTLTLNQSATFNDKLTVSNSISTANGTTLTLAKELEYATANNSTVTALTLKDGATVNTSSTGTLTATTAAAKGAFTKNGTGTLVLSTVSQLSGTVTVNAGILQIGNGDQILNSAQVNGGTLRLTGTDNIDWGNSVNIQILGGTLDLDARQSVDSTTAITLNNGTIEGDGGANRGYTVGLELHNTSTLTITSTGASSISTNIGMRKENGDNGGTVKFNVTDGALTVSGKIEKNQPTDATISGKVTKSGAGELILSGNNTYANGTTIEAGTVTTQHTNALGSGGVTMTGGELKVTDVADTDSDLSLKGMLEMNATASAKLATAGTTLNLGTTGSVKKTNADGSQYVTISSDGATAASMTAKSANAQLIQLAQDASFTIQDMTLTNTTIAAATTDTRVNLNNVSGDATLATGTFGLQMQAGDPLVGMGGASLSYGVAGTPSLTLGTTDAKLVITADPSADVSGIYRDYTLTFNLNVSLDSIPQSGDDWKALVGFDGWLGTMLENQGATYQVADGAAQVAEGNSAPAVSYGYTAGGGGGNVGTLVITISGLNVPEPTTATLSLLALAALAARRRRND